MELTNQDRARIFAMYFGAEVKPNAEHKSKGKIYMVGDSTICIRQTILPKVHFVPIDECRLVLRPLSALSDEDIVRIAKMAIQGPALSIDNDEIHIDGPIHRDGEKVAVGVYCRCFEGTVYIFYDFAVRIQENEQADVISSTDNALAIGDMLRERGYALPYRGESLFDLGIAISAEANTIIAETEMLAS